MKVIDAAVYLSTVGQSWVAQTRIKGKTWRGTGYGGVQQAALAEVAWRVVVESWNDNTLLTDELSPLLVVPWELP